MALVRPSRERRAGARDPPALEYPFSPSDFGALGSPPEVVRLPVLNLKSRGAAGPPPMGFSVLRPLPEVGLQGPTQVLMATHLAPRLRLSAQVRVIGPVLPEQMLRIIRGLEDGDLVGLD